MALAGPPHPSKDRTLVDRSPRHATAGLVDGQPTSTLPAAHHAPHLFLAAVPLTAAPTLTQALPGFFSQRQPSIGSAVSRSLLAIDQRGWRERRFPRESKQGEGELSRTPRGGEQFNKRIAVVTAEVSQARTEGLPRAAGGEPPAEFGGRQGTGNRRISVKAIRSRTTPEKTPN